MAIKPYLIYVADADVYEVMTWLNSRGIEHSRHDNSRKSEGAEGSHMTRASKKKRNNSPFRLLKGNRQSSTIDILSLLVVQSATKRDLEAATKYAGHSTCATAIRRMLKEKYIEYVDGGPLLKITEHGTLLLGKFEKAQREG